MKFNISGKIVGNMIGIIDVILYLNGKDLRLLRENGLKNVFFVVACVERAFASVLLYCVFCVKLIVCLSVLIDFSIFLVIVFGIVMFVMFEMISLSDFKVEIVDCESVINCECISVLIFYVVKLVCLGGKIFVLNFCRNLFVFK